MRRILFLALFCLLLVPCLVGQSKNSRGDKFRAAAVSSRAGD